MNARSKLFAAMAALVLLVVGVYFGTTHGYLGSRFRDYSDDRLARSLVGYYASHHSWDGVGESGLLEGDSPRRADAGGALLVSEDGVELLHAGNAAPEVIQEMGLKQQLVQNGTTVGLVYLYRWESAELVGLRDYIVSSMLTESFRVAGVVTIAGLASGLWLTSRLTKPLRRLIPAIDRIADGDMDSRVAVESRDEYGKVAEALNAMADRLRRAEEMRKQLTADVSHELRTPLTSIQCQLENLQMSGRPVPPEALLPLQDELIRLSAMVSDLQLLARAESGTLPLDRRPADLVQVAQSVVDAVKFEAAERQIHLNHVWNDTPVSVNADVNRIRQSLYNILINALRYTPAGGTVACRVEPASADAAYPDDVRVIISDTGIGIAKEYLPYLFERFYRVQSSRSRHDGGLGLGLGLGLAIAKQFIELHGGRIEVNSEPGQGTEFVIFLPANASAGPGT